jgi:hypothetical protein
MTASMSFRSSISPSRERLRDLPTIEIYQALAAGGQEGSPVQLSMAKEESADDCAGHSWVGKMLAQDCQEKQRVLRGLVLRLVRRSAALSKRDRVKLC